MDKDLRNLERTILSGDVARLPEYVRNQERLGKTQTIYLVVSDSFEYNDEYYTQAEGCEPIRAFLSEEAAKREASYLSIDWLRETSTELSVWHYERNLVELFEIDDDYVTFLASNGATDITDAGFDVSDCTDEQCLQILSKLTICVYSTRRIVLTDGMCASDEILSFCHAEESKASSTVEADEDADEDENEEPGM